MSAAFWRVDLGLGGVSQRPRWTGEGGKPAAWRSSDCSSRAFCPVCGSTIGAIDDAPVIALVLGTFDSSNHKKLAPEKHSYVSPRPNWWHIAIGDRPAPPG